MKLTRRNLIRTAAGTGAATMVPWRALYADAYDWGPDVGREVVEE